MFDPFGAIRHEMMQGLIRSCDPESKVIVDLGAGNPAITDGISCRKRIKIDIDDSTHPDIVHDLTAGIPLPENSADICVASEVIEHLYHSKRFISEIRRVLKNGGFLVLSTPNICSLKYRLAFLLGYIPAHAAKADCFYKDDRPGHIRDYNLQDLTDLLLQFGLHVRKATTDGLSFGGRTLIPRSLLLKTMGDALIVKAQVVK